MASVEWERGVWWLTGSHWMRKSIVLCLALGVIWVLRSDALIEWRQEHILERMTPFLDRIATPAEGTPTPSVPAG